MCYYTFRMDDHVHGPCAHQVTADPALTCCYKAVSRQSLMASAACYCPRSNRRERSKTGNLTTKQDLGAAVLSTHNLHSKHYKREMVCGAEQVCTHNLHTLGPMREQRLVTLWAGSRRRPQSTHPQQHTACYRRMAAWPGSLLPTPAGMPRPCRRLACLTPPACLQHPPPCKTPLFLALLACCGCCCCQ
jgi:hypothetical protein